MIFVSVEQQVKIEEEENENEKMPIVASVEEEQPLNEIEKPIFVVATTDGNDEKILFDDISAEKPTKKTRVRSRSSRSRRTKRNKQIDEDEENLSSSSSFLLMKLISEEHIDEYLRTLFISTNDKTRNRSQTAEENPSVFELFSSGNTNETNSMSSTISDSPSSCSAVTTTTTDQHIST